LCADILPLNKNIKIILNYVIGPLVFCLLAFSIYRQLFQQPDWRQSVSQVWQALSGGAAWQLIGVLALMLLNWGIEARKWQVVIHKIQPISFIQSWKAVHAGLAMSFFMPNRIGEYVGRVLYIQEGKRIEAVSLTIVSSMAQLLVTWLAGIAGIICLKSYIGYPGDDIMETDYFWLNGLLYVTIGATAILTLLYFRLSWVVRWIEVIPRINRFVDRIRVLEDFNATILVRILSLSIARYAVFIGQYYLLFLAFKVGLYMAQVFGTISVVFLVLSIIPTIAVIDLGVRWKASIRMAEIFSGNVAGILATSLAIWIINLVIPALVGGLLILGIKIFNNKK
jgi:hypothetical protein